MTAWIKAEKADGVLDLAVGNGRRHNALPTPAWLELAVRVEEESDDERLRVVVIRGRGGAFCSGSDLTEWADAPLEAVEESFAAMESAFTAIERCPVPVVAAIRGVAAGAGCQLALACDLRYMAASGGIGMPIARLGILPSTRFVTRMIDLAGPSTARELLYTGALLEGAEAARLGLVTRAVPDHELEGFLARQVGRIAAQPPEAIRAAKKATRHVLDHSSGTANSLNWPAVSATEFPQAVLAFLRRSQGTVFSA